MRMALDGLSQINIELTSRCDKNCRFCGHQNPKVNPAIAGAGDMPIELLAEIAVQVPKGVVVQFHRDGEPLLYPALAEALALFDGRIRSIVTHGAHLGARAAEIIGHAERVTVSVFSGDRAQPEQLAALSEFLARRGEASLPAVAVKVVGPINIDELAPFAGLGLPLLRRQLHHPKGDWAYERRSPPIPESMICAELLSHPSVDWRGDLYICNRLQPERFGQLGSLRTTSLKRLWNGSVRRAIIADHLHMRRELQPACKGCQYWGHPA